jgi:hypothetical protein
MTTEQHIGMSLEKMFLSDFNVRDISGRMGRNAENEMKIWAASKKLDDYESVQMDYSEALDFANNEFSAKHLRKKPELNMAAGQDYPKYYIEEGVERYDVDDFRTYDAQQVQEVMRSNANFRYGNKIKEWRIGQHKRHYDKEEHEKGFADTRELNTLERGYNMSKIYGPNEYESADSTMYSY